VQARQGKARQGKARQGKARQGKARQGKARQGKANPWQRRRFVYNLAFPQACQEVAGVPNCPPTPLAEAPEGARPGESARHYRQ
jgi:hypothetical protein